MAWKVIRLFCCSCMKLYMYLMYLHPYIYTNSLQADSSFDSEMKRLLADMAIKIPIKLYVRKYMHIAYCYIYLCMECESLIFYANQVILRTVRFLYKCAKKMTAYFCDGLRISYLFCHTVKEGLLYYICAMENNVFIFISLL